MAERHPPGLYVLFFTEMWERFGFYTMAGMFTLYLKDNEHGGFGWTAEQATSLNANYLMFVYASPLIGGWLADRKLGYRNSVLLGGIIFMAGYLLLAVHSLTAVYAALACLVVGNGFFKPNVSAMVGQLYPEGSALKDRAYNIFYMGINVGALLAPIVAEYMWKKYGFNRAFAVAALGMVVSVAILWSFRRYIETKERLPALNGKESLPEETAQSLATPAAPPRPIDAVPEWKRIGALLVIFLIVIAFWMVFHQNSSTLTYWANDNTDWQVSGVISNAINPFWVITLSFPMVWFWQWLDRRGLEPRTPTKMVFGMLLPAVAFFILYLAARTGEATVPPLSPNKLGPTHLILQTIGAQTFSPGGPPLAPVAQVVTAAQVAPVDEIVTPNRYRVSPAWLLLAYAVLTMGELCLSPMGLSLVSKVAPRRLRGVMMGGWFLATAIGNKLTMIGVVWEYWLHSSFWLLLSGLAVATAVVLLLLLWPLKKAMPGV